MNALDPGGVGYVRRTRGPRCTAGQNDLSHGNRDWLNVLGLAATVAGAASWSALLARAVLALWPLSWIPAGVARPWLWSSIPALFAALAGALAGPAALYVVARVPPGWPTFCCAWPLLLSAACVFSPVVVPWWGMWALAAGLGGTTWLCRRWQGRPVSKSEWPWDALAFAAPLALYLSTLAPSVLPGDSGEFQVVAATLGIPHPTGYPLYLLLGKVFSLLPVHSVAYRLNLLSAVSAAAAVWAVYRVGRVLGLRRAAACVGAGLLAVSDAFWSQATIAEKYSLNAFFVALTLWLALRWRQERQEKRPGQRWLLAWVFCYGLSLTHHRTMALLAPAYLWLAWATDRGVFHWRSALRLLVVFLLPLALYGVLPLFSALDPPYAYVRIQSLRAFLDLVLAKPYQSHLLTGGLAILPPRADELVRLLVRQFGPLGLGLAIGGWVVLKRRNGQAAWLLLVGVLAEMGFALCYDVPNRFVYYLPAYVWLAPCGAVAVDEVLWACTSVGAGGRGKTRHRACSLALAPCLMVAWVSGVTALPTGLGIARWAGMDQRRAYDSLSFGYSYGQLAARAVADSAVVVSDWMPATVLWYTQYVEGLAPTAQVVVVDPLEGQWSGIADRMLAAGRAVYLARPVMSAGDHYALSSAGPLVRVLASPMGTAPAMPHRLDIDLGGDLRLLGSDVVVGAPGPEGSLDSLADGAVEGGSTLHVTLYWQTINKPAVDYAVMVSLADARGYVWLERQSRHPVGGTYPTSRWQVGEVVADYYELVLAPSLPSSEYRLLVQVSGPGGTATAAPGYRDRQTADQVTLFAFQLQKPLHWSDARPATSVRQGFDGGLVLTGVDVPQELRAGETATVELQWLVAQPFDAGSHPALVLVEKNGGQYVVPPLATPTGNWLTGAWVVERYQFAVPDSLSRIELRGRQPVVGWPVRYCLPVRVGTAPLVANFGNLIRLRSYAYRTALVQPGDTLHLTLEWEAVAQVGEPYKVFVHVLGQNGLPIAQQDNEPVSGTYPTTRWQGGERVSDSYAIALPSGLAPGEYQVEVGLYRLSDLSRLPVVGKDQVLVDDKVYLAPVVVR